jgi:TonB-linked SusC/RagA family outer membrane protein
MMTKFLLFSLSLVFVFNVSWAQDRVVAGKVVSTEDGSPLPGVNVVLKGTSNGTVTDTDGSYKLNVPAAGGTLVFTFIGMQSQEVPIGSQATIDLKMQADVQQLNEVVVNAIGETTPRDRLGIAPTTVSGSSMISSGETSVLNSLAAKAPGVNLTRNGSDPGAGSYIQLRGQSSISGDLQPLIVIDGMPMYNSYQDDGGNQVDGVQQQSRLNDLNPDDISSVEIIKSASAAALWGSRAANGVIVITTKKGKSSSNAAKLNIGYTGTLSFDRVNRVPQLQTTFGQGRGGTYQFNNARSWGDKISDRSGEADATTGTAYVQFPDGTQRFAIPSGTPANPHGGKNSTDVFDHNDEVFRTGHFLENSINLNGGNERSNFYVSYSNLDQQGVIRKNSDYQRNTARINASTLLTDKLSVSTNITYSNVRSNRAQQGSNTGGIFLGGLRTPADYNNLPFEGTAYDADGIPTPNKQISFRNQIGSNDNSGFDNPFWTINHNKSRSNVNRLIGNVELNYDLFDWLSLKGNAGVDTYTDRRTDFINAQSAISPGGNYREQALTETQWNSNLYATARKKFSNAFNGSILLGFNYNSRQFNNVGATGLNFIVPDAPANLLNTNPTQRTPFNLATTVKTAAAFTQISLGFYDQLFVDLTGRAEAASTFGPQAKSLFYYPSASVAWQFSKLIGTNPVVSFGKLRASYGVVGRQPDPYQNLTQYNATNFLETWGATLNGGVYGVGGYGVSTTVGNPVIRPERKHEIEGGVDMRFFNDRVNFSATAYYNKVTDVILATNVATSSGFSNIVANAGELQNKGLEFSLEPTWVKTGGGFTWSTNFLWYNYRNKVLSLAGAESVFLTGGGFSDGSSRAVAGQPLGVLWGTYYDKDANGNYILDANGFPKLAPKEGVIGNPNPNYRASIGNTFRYKGFSLYALFDFQIGGQMWNGTRGALMNYGTFVDSGIETTLSAADAAQTKTYDALTVATSPRAHANPDGSYTFRGTVDNFGGGPVAKDELWYTNNGGGFNVNGPYVESATWSRLRELTLGYTLSSQRFRNSSKLTSVTVSLTGRNVFLWTNYKGIDPETNLTGAQNGRGIDYFQNPNTKSFLVKLTINY